MEKITRKDIFNALRSYFDFEELRNLAFRLDVDPDQLPSDTRESFALSLISYFDRRNALDVITEEIFKLRPNSAFRFVNKTSKSEAHFDERVVKYTRLLKRLSYQKLTLICDYLQIDFNSLSGKKNEKINRLMQLVIQKEKLDDLIKYIESNRSNLFPQKSTSKVKSNNNFATDETFDTTPEIRQDGLEHLQLRVTSYLDQELQIGSFLTYTSELLVDIEFAYCILALLYISKSSDYVMRSVRALNIFDNQNLNYPNPHFNSLLRYALMGPDLHLVVKKFIYGSPQEIDLLGIGKVVEVLVGALEKAAKGISSWGKDKKWRHKHEEEMAQEELRKARLGNDNTEIQNERERNKILLERLNIEQQYHEISMDLVKKTASLGTAELNSMQKAEVSKLLTSRIQRLSEKPISFQVLQTEPSSETKLLQ